MKPPAFQFYVDDFLGGTLNFTDAEVGLYMRLLCVQWSIGSLIDDEKELRNYGKGQTPIEKVKAKFKKCGDGKLRNKRMEIERKKQNAFRKSRSLNGKLGGRPKKASGKLVVLNGEAKKSSPSPTPSPVSNTNPTHANGVSASVAAITNRTALDRLEVRQKELRGQFPLTDMRLKTEWNDLKTERIRLMGLLGFKA